VPSINASIGPSGPLLNVLVGLSVPHRAAVMKAGGTIPSYVTGQFLLDTGASCTCIDPAFVTKLGLTPTGTVGMQTPSTGDTPAQCYQYDVSLFIPDDARGSTGYFIDAIPVIETGLSMQGIEGLLGRDVLDRCVLIYNASINAFTLSY